jgi:hypothetical protein
MAKSRLTGVPDDLPRLGTLIRCMDPACEARWAGLDILAIDWERCHGFWHL